MNKIATLPEKIELYQFFVGCILIIFPAILFIILYLKAKNFKIPIMIGAIAYLIMYCFCIFYISHFVGIPFSSKSSSFSDFGAFFGGVIGTIFSFITLLLLLWNIYKQNNENKKTILIGCSL